MFIDEEDGDRYIDVEQENEIDPDMDSEDSNRADQPHYEYGSSSSDGNF